MLNSSANGMRLFNMINYNRLEFLYPKRANAIAPTNDIGQLSYINPMGAVLY